MSVNSKNLTYETNEPAFLKKLRSEYGGTDLSRQQRPQARPRKQRNADEENDDEPVYVHDEDPHEPISKADYDALLKAPSTEQESAKSMQPASSVQFSPGTESSSQAHSLDQVQQALPTKERTAGIGRSSKKRSAKIIGDDDSADEVRKLTTGSDAPKKHVQTKGKKVKLSFEDG
ncbi:MAG: hypothetical protein Q9186_000274 [Xanthomendoza sp. 1 TL-2023]